jgi:hypothetical protein
MNYILYPKNNRLANSILYAANFNSDNYYCLSSNPLGLLNLDKTKLIPSDYRKVSTFTSEGISQHYRYMFGLISLIFPFYSNPRKIVNKYLENTKTRINVFESDEDMIPVIGYVHRLIINSGIIDYNKEKDYDKVMENFYGR